jgi:protein-S-isoprenylcysteine O-methyltransferase Ste14
VPELALIGWIAFAVLALGGRIVLQLIRTGETGVSGISGSVGSVEWLGGTMFAASLVAGGIAPLLQIEEVVLPVEALDATGLHIAGIALSVFGLAICVGAQLAMGASWRIGVDESERTELVTDGPFAVVRNPIYSGVIPLVAGLALLAPNAVSLAAFATLFISLEAQVRLVEEPHLLRAHESEYREYASRVGRFVPGLGLLRERP